MDLLTVAKVVSKSHGLQVKCQNSNR